jgi:sec-independent protein translocase protein TatA
MFDGLFQPVHLLFILLVALVVFGPSKLPELGAGLGKSIREFKKAMSDEGREEPKTPLPEKEASRGAGADAGKENSKSA